MKSAHNTGSLIVLLGTLFLILALPPEEGKAQGMELSFEEEEFLAEEAAKEDPKASSTDGSRQWVSMKDRSPFVRYNPLVLGLRGLLYVYQNGISQQLSSKCMYHPSCSEFARNAISEYGLFKGSALGADRLNRCTPIAEPDLEEMKKDGEGRYIDPVGKYMLK
jgi:putative component of membrane protein insertase Oxa1/YidC/SpoIIIJ protein YidD